MFKQPTPAPTASAIGPTLLLSHLVGRPALKVYLAPSHHPTTPETIVNISNELIFYVYRFGWSGGAMVLGKLPVPGRPTHLG